MAKTPYDEWQDQLASETCAMCSAPATCTVSRGWGKDGPASAFACTACAEQEQADDEAWQAAQPVMERRY